MAQAGWWSWVSHTATVSEENVGHKTSKAHLFGWLFDSNNDEEELVGLGGKA
jgi:hypothetical protein